VALVELGEAGARTRDLLLVHQVRLGRILIQALAHQHRAGLHFDRRVGVAFENPGECGPL